MLLITIWSAMTVIPSVGSPSLTSALKIVGFITAVEFALAVVVALACWLVLELAGFLVEGREPSKTGRHYPSHAQTCASQYSFRDEFDFPADTSL